GHPRARRAAPRGAGPAGRHRGPGNPRRAGQNVMARTLVISAWAPGREDVMSFQKTPGGSRGARVPPSNAVTRALNRVAMSWHRRARGKFHGQDLPDPTPGGAKPGPEPPTT